MRSRVIVAFCTLVGAFTLVACSGKIAGVPDPSTDPSSPGSSASGGEDPSAPTSSPPGIPTTTPSPGAPGGPGGRCFEADLGIVCRDAPEMAKVHGTEICEGVGATLVGFSGDSSGRCSATCCFASDVPGNPGKPPVPGPDPSSPWPDPSTPPVPWPDPSTPPPVPWPDPSAPPDASVPPVPTGYPPACSYASFGDGMACIPYADVGPLAQAACGATGQAASSVHLAAPCPGGVLFGRVECCGPAGTPGAPPRK